MRAPLGARLGSGRPALNEACRLAPAKCHHDGRPALAHQSKPAPCLCLGWPAGLSKSAEPAAQGGGADTSADIDAFPGDTLADKLAAATKQHQ